MIPIRDDNPQVSVPWATYALIGGNAVAWVFLQGAGIGESFEPSICEYGLIPANIFGNDGGYGKGACEGLDDYGLLNVLTSMFMHGGWMHILGNMLFLWIFGGNVEDAMGPIRFLIFYTLCGIAAAAAQILSGPSSVIPMVGASGAIGGVMGGYLMIYPRVKVHILVPIFIIFWTFRVPAWAMLGYWIGLQLFEGMISMNSTGGGVAFWAHVGGFVAGALAIFVLKDDELLFDHPYHGWTDSVDPASVWDDPNNKQN
jgi:membrane associated rhomboid family serine protease